MKPLHALTLFAAALAAAWCAAAQNAPAPGAPAPGAAEGHRIGAPYEPTSLVDATGALHEDWGVFALRLIEPEGVGVSQRGYDLASAPTVTSEATAGGVTFLQRAYRAPIAPNGVDVVEADLSNTSAAEVEVRLRVDLPESVESGDCVGVAGGRPVVGLPKGLVPARQEREWGCAGGVASLPGWAKPSQPCDPAFANIRAGMGGVPIVYRFAVPANAKRAVFVGLCESFHEAPGRRPFLLRVEGAAELEIDPIAKWGQHVPGVLRFDAQDANGDGRLEVIAAPKPGAPDLNPIVNVIWIFAPEVNVNEADLIAGKANDKAQYYVDAGGAKDQALYRGGPLDYTLKLAPGATQTMTFFVACQGCGGVPNPATTAWNRDSLRKAAVDVCTTYVAKGAPVLTP